jgi:uncharacterized protein YjiS (DUF1127 family)
MSLALEERPMPLFVGPVQACLAWYRRHRTFQALSSLDDRLLADIGVARDDIAGIASRF